MKIKTAPMQYLTFYHKVTLYVMNVLQKICKWIHGDFQLWCYNFPHKNSGWVLSTRFTLYLFENSVADQQTQKHIPPQETFLELIWAILHLFSKFVVKSCKFCQESVGGSFGLIFDSNLAQFLSNCGPHTQKLQDLTTFSNKRCIADQICSK